MFVHERVSLPAKEVDAARTGNDVLVFPFLVLSQHHRDGAGLCEEDDIILILPWASNVSLS